MEDKYFRYLNAITKISDVKKEYIKDKKVTDEMYSFTYESDQFTISFNHGFPGELPEFKMINPRKHPHVAKWGTVCMNRIEDIVFDVDDTEIIIRKSFNSFFEILKIDKSKFDYSTEFSDYIKYFKSYDKEEQVYIFQEFDSKTPHITNVYKNNKSVFISDSETIDKNYLKINKNELTYSKGIFIPLKSFFPIPEINSDLYINEVLNYTFEKHATLINKILRRDKTRYILISIENNNGFFIYFLFTLPIKLSSIIDAIKVSQISIVNNLQINYLKKRGSTYIRKERVLLIGLGSLGSEVLYHLCKTGFENIDICDFDVLEPTNTYRHFLGYNKTIITSNNKILKMSKTDLLKNEMKSRYPSVNIGTFENRIEELINTDKIDLNLYDYIINATGNMVSNLFLNNHAYRTGLNKKMIFGWIEPYGVALHMFISQTSEPGCLSCLNKSLNNVRLAKPGNYLIKNDNCIGTFTTFGSLEVSRLAIDIVRVVIKNDFNKNRHHVILGDNGEFLTDGHELTKYSTFTEIEINKLGEDILYEGCSICGNNGIKN